MNNNFINGNLIRYFREKFQITQNEIANELGINPSVLSKIENGTYGIKKEIKDSFTEIARKYLFDEEQNESSSEETIEKLRVFHKSMDYNDDYIQDNAYIIPNRRNEKDDVRKMLEDRISELIQDKNELVQSERYYKDVYEKRSFEVQELKIRFSSLETKLNSLLDTVNDKLRKVEDHLELQLKSVIADNRRVYERNYEEFKKELKKEVENELDGNYEKIVNEVDKLINSVPEQSSNIDVGTLVQGLAGLAELFKNKVNPAQSVSNSNPSTLMGFSEPIQEIDNSPRITINQFSQVMSYFGIPNEDIHSFFQENKINQNQLTCRFASEVLNNSGFQTNENEVRQIIISISQQMETRSETMESYQSSKKQPKKEFTSKSTTQPIQETDSNNNSDGFRDELSIEESPL